MGLPSSIGRRHGRDSTNRISDQKIVQDLLNRIPVSVGGAGGTLNKRMLEGVCSNNLYLAILNFQKRNVPKFADGHVDPGSATLDVMERMAKMNDLVVSAAKTISDVAEKAARSEAAVDHSVNQMVGSEPGSETWNIVGSDAPLSGAVPFAAGPGVASVARIPIPGTNGLALELSPRGFVPKGGSTSAVFIQDVTGKKHLRLDYGYNVKSRTIDYHWNQKGTYNTFGIADHTTVGTAGRVAYKSAKYLKWGGRVLLVVGIAIDVWSIVQSSSLYGRPPRLSPDGQGLRRVVKLLVKLSARPGHLSSLVAAPPLVVFWGVSAAASSAIGPAVKRAASFTTGRRIRSLIRCRPPNSLNPLEG